MTHLRFLNHGTARRRLAAVAVLALAVSLLAGGGAFAARPTVQPAARPVESRVNALLAKMTLDEKLEQLQLLADWQATDDEVRRGSAGSSASPTRRRSTTCSTSRSSSRGCTSRSCSRSTRSTASARCSRSRSARRAASTRRSPPPTDRSARARRRRSASSRSTARWSTSRTSRAGAASPRAAGEDPYLGSVMAAARVHAAQGTDYSVPDKVVTSVKHFAAYGQPEGGRDYNTTDMSTQRLYNVYLPPYKAAVDAGSGHRDVLVQRDQRCARLRQPPDRDRHPQERLGLRRIHRERLHGGRRAASLPASEPGQRSLRPWRRGRRPASGAAALERRHRHPRWSSTNLRRLRQAAARRGQDLDATASTTLCAGFCGSSSAPDCSNTPTSTRRRRTRSSCCPTPSAAERKAAERVDGAAQERRQRASAGPDQVRPR